MILLNDNFTTNTVSNYQLIDGYNYHYEMLYTPDELNIESTYPTSSPTPPSDWWLLDSSYHNTMIWRTTYASNNEYGPRLYSLLDGSGNQIKGTEASCEFTIKHAYNYDWINIVEPVDNSSWFKTDEAGIRMASYIYYKYSRYGGSSGNIHVYNNNNGVDRLGNSIYANIQDIDYTNKMVKINYNFSSPAGKNIIRNQRRYGYETHTVMGFYINGIFVGIRPGYKDIFVGWGDHRKYNEWDNNSSWRPYPRNGFSYRAGTPTNNGYYRWEMISNPNFDPSQDINFRVVSSGGQISIYVNNRCEVAFESNPRKQSLQYLLDDNIYLYSVPGNYSITSQYACHLANVIIKDFRVAPKSVDFVNLMPLKYSTDLTPTVSWKATNARYSTEGMYVLDSVSNPTNKLLSEVVSEYGIEELVNIRLDGNPITEDIDYIYNNSIQSFVWLNDSVNIDTLDEKTLLPIGVSVNYVEFDGVNFIGNTVISNYKIPFVCKYYSYHVESISAIGYSTELGYHASVDAQQAEITRSTQEKYSSSETIPIYQDLINLETTTISAEDPIWDVNNIKTDTNSTVWGNGYYTTKKLPTRVKVDLGEPKDISAIGFIGWMGGTPSNYRWRFIYDTETIKKDIDQYTGQSGEYVDIYRKLDWDVNGITPGHNNKNTRDYYILPKTIKAQYIYFDVYDNMSGIYNSTRSWYYYDRNRIGRDDDVYINKLYLYGPIEYSNKFQIASLSAGTLTWQDIDKEIRQDELNNAYLRFKIPNDRALASNSKYNICVYSEGITKC